MSTTRLSDWAAPCTAQKAADSEAARIDFLKYFISISWLSMRPSARLPHGWLRGSGVQAHRIEITQTRPHSSFHATLQNVFAFKGLR
jgi:hypothetical protein